ncbi:MAG: hypothetical protein EPO40_16610 [Myxococcaceae bacterium]|nr:MAG: hypothetical protein EPO40_16610 [Myxococcaceae bacterium]
MAERLSLGEEIRRERVSRKLSLKQCARHIGLSGLSGDVLRVVESGEHSIDAWSAEYIALRFEMDRATKHRWIALTGHVPGDITNALQAQPEKWDAVRALLGLEAALAGCP